MIMGILFAFVFGACIGSYINVIRVRGFIQSCIGRSYCPNCKKQLSWYHLVPILSFIFLRAKCGYCDNKIDVKYFLYELVFGIISSFLFYIWSVQV